MAEVLFQMSQLVNLAIGSPEIGAVNFNLLQRVLLEILKLSDLESATVTISAEDAAKLEETYSIKPTAPVEEVAIGEVVSIKSSRKSGHQCPIDAEKVDHLLEDMKQLKFDLEDLTTKLANMAATTETVPFQELHASKSNIDEMYEKMKNIEEQLEVLKGLDISGADDRTISQRLIYLEKHVNVHTEQLENINNILDDKLKGIVNRFSTMEKDMGIINEKLNIAESSTQLSQRQASRADIQATSILEQSSTLNNLVNRLSTVQQDLDKLTLQMTSLIDEQEQRQMVIDVMTEQMDLLKMVKADKTNVEDVLAAKADLSQVHRKVSHDHFETKMLKLNDLLDDAFNRLDAHEEMWQQEVEYIKTDIQNKLDKTEFSPMKDYINERLKLLQDKMKTLMNQNREGAAAGTKKRLIKDVQCISCDNDSVMKPEIHFDDMTPPPSLPTHQSVKPYLTYELDKVRKQQKRLPGKNMHHFEEMVKEGKDGKELKQISSKPSRISDNMLAFEKMTREGREALSKGLNVMEQAFGMTNTPSKNFEDMLRQGREAYQKGLQTLSKAFRIPGINMRLVENTMKECKEQFSKGHKVIEYSSRPPDTLVTAVDDMMKDGQKIFDTFLSTPGFNMKNFDESMEQFHRTFEKNQKVLDSATRGMDEKVVNVGGKTFNVQEGGYRTDSGGEIYVKRYVGGSHTKTTPNQRLSRAGNFYDTWGPVITAVRPPAKSEA